MLVLRTPPPPPHPAHPPRRRRRTGLHLLLRRIRIASKGDPTHKVRNSEDGIFGVGATRGAPAPKAQTGPCVSTVTPCHRCFRTTNVRDDTSGVLCCLFCMWSWAKRGWGTILHIWAASSFSWGGGGGAVLGLLWAVGPCSSTQCKVSPLSRPDVGDCPQGTCFFWPRARTGPWADGLELPVIPKHRVSASHQLLAVISLTTGHRW